MTESDLIKISEQFNFNGSPLWLGIERTAQPGADPIAEFLKAREVLVNSFKAISGQTMTDYNTGGGAHGTESGVMPEDERISIVARDIMECQVLDLKNDYGVQTGLLGYETIAKAHPLLQEAYDKRYSELQNKQL